MRAFAKRLSRVERSLLTVIVMLTDRGFRVPDRSDTDVFLRSNNLFNNER